ncbi:MAG: AAA family ATPase [Desulfobacterales bacterium]
MPIITISRGSYHRAKAVAEKLARKLGYGCLSRDEVIENLGEFQAPEIKLVRNLHDAFSVLERFPNGKERFVSAMRASILQRLLEDNAIYHGLAGHYFIQDISHVLKVRIVSDIDSRISKEVDRTGISLRDARNLLLKDDEERRKWCMVLYGIDIFDPINYHLVIKVDPLTEDDAVDIIADTVARPAFQPTEASRRLLADLALAARVRHALFEYPSASVSAKAGSVLIGVKAPEAQEKIIHSRIESILADIPEVERCDIRIDPYY